MATDIGPKIGLDGEAEFRKALQAISTQAKTMASEMKAVTSEFDKNDTSQEKLPPVLPDERLAEAVRNAGPEAFLFVCAFFAKNRRDGAAGKIGFGEKDAFRPFRCNRNS